jgi:hypothetical protein
MNVIKNSCYKILLVAAVVLAVFSGCAVFETEKRDYENFYTVKGAVSLGVALAASGLCANTDADYEIRQYYAERLKSVNTDRASKWAEPMGDGLITVPVFAAALAAGELMGNSAAGGAFSEWGERSIRGVAVGGPLLLALQKTLGSGRPEEDGSRWDCFDDNNAASGHAFIGALPFISAAKMSDELYFKIPLYAASTLTGLSRINDDDHYFSQVLLGWALAYLSASAVDETVSGGGGGTRIFIVPDDGGVFLGVQAGF